MTPDNYARIVLDNIPKKTVKAEKERILAYEIRERFGFNKMTAFMKKYRSTVALRAALKAAPLRAYAQSKKEKAIKRKEAAITRKLNKST
jgi:ribosomal protein S24E